ncbi:hypothetical protein Hdeb2414_s0004g00131811 [Helianthus debilis subsp. tardiflorus]
MESFKASVEVKTIICMKCEKILKRIVKGKNAEHEMRKDIKEDRERKKAELEATWKDN